MQIIYKHILQTSFQQNTTMLLVQPVQPQLAQASHVQDTASFERERPSFRGSFKTKQNSIGDLSNQIYALEVWFNAGEYNGIFERQYCKAILKNLKMFRDYAVKENAETPGVIWCITRLWTSLRQSMTTSQVKSQKNEADSTNILTGKLKIRTIEQEKVPFTKQQ